MIEVSNYDDKPNQIEVVNGKEDLTKYKHDSHCLVGGYQVIMDENGNVHVQSSSSRRKHHYILSYPTPVLLFFENMFSMQQYWDQGFLELLTEIKVLPFWATRDNYDKVRDNDWIYCRSHPNYWGEGAWFDYLLCQ